MQLSRSYLRVDKNGYYTQSKDSLNDKNAYENETEDTLSMKIAGLAGLGAVAGSAKALYDDGTMQSFLHRFILDASNSQIQDFTQVKNAIDSSLYSDYSLINSINLVRNNVIPNAFETARQSRAVSQVAALKDIETIQYIHQRAGVLHRLNAQEITRPAYDTLVATMNRTLINEISLDAADEASLLAKTGFRHATLEDLIRLNRLDIGNIGILETLQREIPGLLKMRADRNILIDAAGNLADTRGTVAGLKKIADGVINETQIPILGINPLKMFHLDDLLNTSNYKTPLFAFIDEKQTQPLITKTTNEVGSALVQIGENIHNTINGATVAEGMTSVSTSSGTARLIRKMTGIQPMHTTAKSNTRMGRMLADFARKLDYGAQPYQYTQAFDLLTPGTWLPSMVSKFIYNTSPLESTVETPAYKAFGSTAKRVYVPKGKGLDFNAIKKSASPLREFGRQAGEFLEQFGAGRKNLGGVTKSTMVPYMLIERINSSLEAFGLGLSYKSIGSAADTYVNLMSKRILPVVATIGALKYIDYKLENRKTGKSPSDAIGETVAAADINMAALREKTGVNKKMERLKELSPGVNFLEEIPFIGKIFDTKSKKEAEEYWENGSKPIRKGRWWSLGNTPYTGGRVEYFKPNMKRLNESDYKYTDVLYGSKKEYWENSWFPNLDNPFAPIKHFITDPYHYEKKHYKDRPYPISGGINEFKEIPIVGGFVDATVGRVLKPQKKYHEEYWNGEYVIDKDDVISPWGGEASSPAIGGSPMPAVSGLQKNIPDEQVSVGLNKALKNINVGVQPTSFMNGPGQQQQMGSNVKYGDFTSQAQVPFKTNGMIGALENYWYDTIEIEGFFGFTKQSATTSGIVKRPRVQAADNISSYQKTFWEKSLGGYGGEISEIFRRFIPNKRYEEKQLEINPIRNTMPTWLPGKEYFIDFLHGDPYDKIKEGEYRLPGAGYEALHHIEDPTKFKIGSSSLGKSVDDMVKHYLQIDDISIAGNEKLKDILASGTLAHEEQEKIDKESKKAVATEVYVKDNEANVEGWIDAIIKDKTSKSGYAILDYKTINQKGFEKAKAGYGKYENVAQIQWYMHMTGQSKGYLKYINRDNPDEAPITLEYKYDPQYIKDAYARLSQARGILQEGLDKGVIQRGDLYSPLDRFRILADVAPYSDNYKYYNALMTKLPLREEEKKEVDKIQQQVSAVKQKMRLTPYRFKTANLKYEDVTVKEVLENGTILTEEYQDNPLKLAAIDFNTGESTEEGRRNMAYLKKHFTPGKKISISYTADDAKKINNDTYKTISVIARSNKLNINKDMIKKKYATEKEDDWSPTGVHVRFSKGEIAYGKLFESLSHMDTYSNTKYMQARSALEMYERKDVYGKDWQDWTEPIKDFLEPTIQNTTRKNPLVATVIGGLIGSRFGKKGSFARIVGTAIGATIGGTVSTAHAVKENVTGKTYIPKRREKERELNEYIDILKYIKDVKLYNQYRKLAIEKEGVDPSIYINRTNKDDEIDKRRTRKLEAVKRDLNSGQISTKKALKKLGYEKAETEDDLKHQINKELEYLSSKKYTAPTTPLAAKAVMYYNESKKTAYAYEPGDSVQNIMAALGRRERKYLQPFMEAPEEERQRILKVVPNYMKRPLQSAYGMKVDKKEPLKDYFKRHYLPEDNWAGWNEDVSLDDVKIKMVKHEAMDASEFDIWEDDKVRADHLNIPIPKMDYAQRSSLVKNKLETVLRDSGLSDVTVSIMPTDNTNIEMNFDLKEDRRNDIENYVNNYGVF